MQKLRILLIGQPNIGKSSLLNALVGSKVVVSNYPGTTVEITQTEKVFDNTRIEFVDTPGIYSISGRSEEERVTGRALFEEDVDGAIVVADASSLERSLYLVLQILEAKVNAIVALNFVEEAAGKGIEIDYNNLARILSVPVIPINPLNKKGIDLLQESLLNIREESDFYMVEYDDHIEQTIEKVSSVIKKDVVNKRFIALRVLEEDEEFYKYLTDRGALDKIRHDLTEHPRIGEDISITRYGTASLIAERSTRISHIRQGKDRQTEEKIDNLLLHNIWGPVATGLLLLIAFGILLYFGNLIQGFLMQLTDELLISLGILGDSVINIILVQAITGVAAGISIALPYVFLFYILLGLMEDIGLLSRLIINAERFLRKLGLPGKAFIPLALGLGCTVPAVRASRVLSSKKEQIHTASLFAFVPCSSRTAIIMGIVGFYGGTRLALYTIFTIIISGLLWAFVVRKIIDIENEPFLLEIPPYRRPLIRNVLAKSWIRMKDFIYIVIPLLAIGGIAYGMLDILKLTDVVIRLLSPIAIWLGLPDKAIMPIIFGFLQKDLTGAMLRSALGTNISLILSPLQLYTFGIATTIGIPCIIALGVLFKEFQYKKALLLLVFSISYGLLIAGLIWRIISIFPTIPL
jgi:ferrous iron transport protein B